MACPTVSKFLCCITLETGGLIMGWVTLLFTVLLMVYMGFALAIVISLYNDYLPENQDIATGVFIFIVFVISIALLYYFILIVASALLIRGTNKRDHTKLMPFMILMCVGIVIHFLSIFTAASAAGIVLAVLLILAMIYFFLCVYSLYNKLRNEKINPPQMQPYPQPVLYATAYQAQPGVQYVQAAPNAMYPPVQSTSAAPSAPNV